MHVHSDARGEERFEQSAKYARAVRLAGGTPVYLGTHLDYAAPAGGVLASLDGVIFSGGGGNHRSYFESGASPSLRETNPARYDYEAELISYASANKMPVLGICRGFQTLAEVLGGELANDLRRLDSMVCHSQEEPADVATHDVTISPGTTLHGDLGPRMRVNSLHGQGVTLPPVGFTVSATADDGLIEAFETEGGLAQGTQFHPEWLVDGEAGFLRIFATLVRHARERQRR